MNLKNAPIVSNLVVASVLASLVRDSHRVGYFQVDLISVSGLRVPAPGALDAAIDSLGRHTELVLPANKLGPDPLLPIPDACLHGDVRVLGHDLRVLEQVVAPAQVIRGRLVVGAPGQLDEATAVVVATRQAHVVHVPASTVVPRRAGYLLAVLEAAALVDHLGEEHGCDGVEQHF